MPILEIITIGTELLLGEITDTNSRYVARTLRDHGIDIYRITTIGDNPGRISATIKEALKRAEIVITTGGLGPTIDDPTRLAVANATDRELIFSAELWEQVQERFKSYDRKPTENNRRQAYIPEGAIPIINPVGTAPCFIVEIGSACVISLPGVPREMEKILHESVIPYLSSKYQLETQIIKATVLHAASCGESQIDELIADLELLSNPTVGLLAHPGQVDIRVTAKARSTEEAINLSRPIVDDLKARLGENIYGVDEETLESVVCLQLNQEDLALCILEKGLEGSLDERIKRGKPNHYHMHELQKEISRLQDLIDEVNQLHEASTCDISFGVVVSITDKVQAFFVYQDQYNITTQNRSYGGPHEYGILWAQNSSLDFLRRQLILRKTNLETGES